MRFAICVVAVLSAACSSDSKPEYKPQALGPEPEVVVVDTVPHMNTVLDDAQHVAMDIQPIGYERLLRYIQKNGQPVYQHHIQLVYWDALDNRHAMIAIYKRDSTDNYRLKPVQISVWVNGREAKPGKKFFGYIITDDGKVHPEADLDPVTKNYKYDLHDDEIVGAIESLGKKAGFKI